MESETKLTSRLIKSWREMRAEVLNITGSAYQAPGWPDVFVCHGLWTGFIEFKGPKTKIQKNQTRIITTLRGRVPVHIVRFVDVDISSQKWFVNVDNQSLLQLQGTDGQVSAQLLKELRSYGNQA